MINKPDNLKFNNLEKTDDDRPPIHTLYSISFIKPVHFHRLLAYLSYIDVIYMSKYSMS